MNVRTFVLTYPQLINQALSEGFSEGDLVLLKRAYEYSEVMFDGYYRAQGEPFVCHLVRAASIVIAEKQPAQIAAASLLHAAYLTGQFQDGRSGKATPSHREEIRQIVGAEVEALIFAYDSTPWHCPEAIEEHLVKIGSYIVEKRHVLMMRLADQLDDYLDLGMVYRGRVNVRERIESYGWKTVELAKALGLLKMADELQISYEQHLSCSIPRNVIRDRTEFYEHPKRRWQKMDYLEKLQFLVKNRAKPSANLSTVSCQM